MLKKFASSLLLITILAGCASPQEEDVKIEMPTSYQENKTEEEKDSQAIKDAQTLVEQLGMEDTTEQLTVAQAINGLFFQGDEALSNDACVYTSTDPHNSDTVAVFITKKADEVIEHIHKYIESTKANAESYAGDQVTKFDHAIVEGNDEKVILVIADDSEKAQEAVDDILK